MNIFSCDTALEYPTSTSAKNLKSITANPVASNGVASGATNIIFQSKDGGQTWQDISAGLPESEQPQDFFVGETELYLSAGNEMYYSKNNLKSPVWEKDNVLYPKSTSIDFNRSGVNIVESEGVLIGKDQKGIKRSTDNGEHWRWVISEGGVGIAVENIKGGFAAITYNTISKTRRIRISMDKGKTWKAIDAGLRPSLSIASIKQVGEYLLCGHPDGIFRSSDMGKTWNMVHSKFNSDKTPNNLDFTVNKRVFTLYVSGNIVYALLRNGGC